MSGSSARLLVQRGFPNVEAVARPWLVWLSPPHARCNRCNVQVSGHVRDSRNITFYSTRATAWLPLRTQSTFVRCLDPLRADMGEALDRPSERGGGERGGSVPSPASGKMSRSSSKVTSSPLSRKKRVRIRLASLTTRYMVEPTITDETMAIWRGTRGGDAWGEARLHGRHYGTGRTSVSMSTHAAEKRQPSVASTPIAKHEKMSVRSAFIPSTAVSIAPSRPRSAFPVPHTDTNVTIATQTKLEQMERVTKVWSIVFAVGLFGGKSISTKLVNVNPAMIAACVPTAEKLVLKSFSSFSRSAMERCLTLLCNSSLSAASIALSSYEPCPTRRRPRGAASCAALSWGGTSSGRPGFLLKAKRRVRVLAYFTPLSRGRSVRGFWPVLRPCLALAERHNERKG